MARGARQQQQQQFSPEDIKRVMETDKDKIEAALAKAVSGGGMPPPRPPVIQEPPAEIIKKNDNTKGGDIINKVGKKAEKKADETTKQDTQCQMSVTEVEFARKCASLDINADMCREISIKHEDTTIAEYIQSINKKIFDETQNGGFSTNIRFRVSPNDWVNVNHIMDWYRGRGFQVLNYETMHPQSGAFAGTMEHNFTISWVG